MVCDNWLLLYGVWSSINGGGVVQHHEDIRIVDSKSRTMRLRIRKVRLTASLVRKKVATSTSMVAPSLIFSPPFFDRAIMIDV
jgi:hypothetical protein